jgi:hypothetical protein
MKKLKVMVVASALAITVACGARPAEIYTAADTSTVAALTKFKSDKDARCDAEQLPASTCKAVAAAFVPVWDAYLAANSLITAEAPLVEVDAAIVKFRQAGEGLRDVVSQIQGNQRQILLDLLEAAIRNFDARNR